MRLASKGPRLILSGYIAELGLLRWLTWMGLTGILKCSCVMAGMMTVILRGPLNPSTFFSCKRKINRGLCNVLSSYSLYLTLSFGTNF